MGDVERNEAGIDKGLLDRIWLSIDTRMTTF